MEQNWYDKIEAYVEGDLSTAERKDMEAAMRDDLALAKEVRVWQLEQAAVLQLRLKKVREQFAERSRHLFDEQRPSPPPVLLPWYRSPWVRVAAVVLPLLVAMWWFWPREVKQEVVDNQINVEKNTDDGKNNPNSTTSGRKDSITQIRTERPAPTQSYKIPETVFAIVRRYANTQTASSGGLQGIQQGLDQAYATGKYSVADSLSEVILQDERMLDTLFEDSKSSLRYVTLSYFSKVRLGKDTQNLLNRCRSLAKTRLVDSMAFIHDWIDVLDLLNRPTKGKEVLNRLNRLVLQFTEHRDLDNSEGDFEKMLLSLQYNLKNR